jgi:hypothetical protein
MTSSSSTSSGNSMKRITHCAYIVLTIIFILGSVQTVSTLFREADLWHSFEKLRLANGTRSDVQYIRGRRLLEQWLESSSSTCKRTHQLVRLLDSELLTPWAPCKCAVLFEDASVEELLKQEMYPLECRIPVEKRVVQCVVRCLLHLPTSDITMSD